MEIKQVFNKTISGYFYRLHLEKGNKFKKVYLNLSENVRNCLSYWLWDVYRENKVMDLQKVTCCHNKFCSNCRKFDLSRAMNNLSPHFQDLILNGYYPFLVTLTIPNCEGIDLKVVLDRMQTAFKKFYNWFSCDDNKGFKKRYMKFGAAVRCVEVTYNSSSNMYHPHYHVLVFSKDYNVVDFDKKYEGEWSNNRQSLNMYSDVDFQIRKLWTIAYDNKTLKDFDNLDVIYIGEIREMDDRGIYEVMKYAFKDTDICNYYVFRDLYFSLYKRKIRQGYGLLYNVKLERESTGKYQELEDYLTVNNEELPSELATYNLETLYSTYSNYIKISRFNKDKYVENIVDQFWYFRIYSKDDYQEG